MVLEAAKWSELCGAKTPMMQRKGDKSLGGIALTNTQRQQIQQICKEFATNSQINHIYKTPMAQIKRIYIMNIYSSTNICQWHVKCCIFLL